jgi:hypothetical protein
MRSGTSLIALLCALPLAAVPCSADDCWPELQCPTEGIVVVDAPLFSRPGEPSDHVLEFDRSEIQCAIDCLDGDREAEHSPDGPGPEADPPEVLTTGVVLELSPNRIYEIDGPLRLPLLSDAGVTIRGQGATITFAPTLLDPAAAIERVVPPFGNDCDADWMSNQAQGWIIENLNLVLDLPLRHQPPGFFSGIELHATGNVRIRGCRFEGFHGGLVLRYAFAPLVENCTFEDSMSFDILFSTGATPPDIAGLPEFAYDPCATETTPMACTECRAGDTNDCCAELAGDPTMCLRSPSKQAFSDETGFHCAVGTFGVRGAQLRNLRHLARFVAPTTRVVLNQADMTAMTNIAFEGVNAPVGIQRFAGAQHLLVVRGLDVAAKDVVGRTDAVLRSQAFGQVNMDGLVLTSGPERLVLDLAGSPGVGGIAVESTSFAFRHVPAIPSFVKMEPSQVGHVDGDARGRYSFIAVDDRTSPASLGLWVGASGWVETPRRLTIDSFRTFKLPIARHLLQAGWHRETGVWSFGSDVYFAEAEGEEPPFPEDPEMQRARTSPP